MSKTLLRSVVVGVAAVFVLSTAVAADGVADVTVTDDEAVASIDLGAGITAEITITFEEVVGLTVENLGLSAELVDPEAIVGRLADSSANAVPVAFPVLVRIEPPLTGGLSFSGPVTIGLHTEALDYEAGSILRLFAAPAGGEFSDITGLVGAGGYRADGYKGGFSEFLVVADARSEAAIIGVKHDRLSALVAEYATSIPSAIHDELATRLESIETLYEAGDALGAASETDAFMTIVDDAAGDEIPNVWRASRDVDNVAGELWAAAATLRFSLRLAG